jgi:hypothetical protein
MVGLIILLKQKQRRFMSVRKLFIKKRYIELVGGVVLLRYELTDEELRSIGKFTRVNISMWLDSHTGPEWSSMLPVEDFHAVCGDIDIPWATKEAFECYSRRKDRLTAQRLAP